MNLSDMWCSEEQYFNGILMSALSSKGLGNIELNIYFLYILFSQSLYNLNVLHVVIKCDIFKNDVTKMGG